MQRTVKSHIDILEDLLNENYHYAFIELLKDQTTCKNIFWGTNNYFDDFGTGFSEYDEITIDKITGKFGHIIQPRAVKSTKIQNKRTKEMAEIFTPPWICNTQNNLIDNAWFEKYGYGGPRAGGWFNNDKKDWVVNLAPVFEKGDDNWKNYLNEIRLEITCGEAPYIVSRHDTVNPVQDIAIPIDRRIGLLDRKFRILNENIDQDNKRAWLEWAKKAVQSVYGYEWQGDSLLIARESIFCSYLDYYEQKFGTDKPDWKTLKSIARIISWNFWQMDGLKMTVPNSCKEMLTCVNQKEINKAQSKEENQLTLFQGKAPEPIFELRPCEGCQTGDVKKHNGIYCLIRDWHTIELDDRKKSQKGEFKKSREEEIADEAIIPFHTLLRD